MREYVAAQSASQTTNPVAPAYPLIWQEGDGHTVWDGRAGVRGSFPFTIKNGNAEDFFVVTETMVPGDAIPFHMHHNAE